MQHRTIVDTALEVGHPQPASMLGPGQSHIEQAQVFGQTLVIGLGYQLWRGL